MAQSNPLTEKLTLLLVSCLTIMSVMTISPALPGMSDELNASGDYDLAIRLILTVPALFIALFSPIAGRLIDRFGRLKFLYVSLAIYGVAGMAGYFLDGLNSILLSRALLGLAVGMSMTIVVTLVGDYYEGIERQKFIGLQIAFMSLGGIIFISGGGALADISWRHPFLLYGLAFLFLPLAFLFLKEPVRSFQQGNDDNEKHRSPSYIWLLFLNTMLMWIIFFLIPVQVPFLFKEIGVKSNTLIGAAIALSTAASAISSISFSKIKGKFNFLSIFGVGYLLMGLGYILISNANSYGMMISAMLISGLGIGLMIPNTNLWVMKIAPAQIRGKEIGKLTMFWFFGQFISPIALLPFTNNYPLPRVFFIAALIMIALGVIAFLLTISKSVKNKMA